MSARSSVRLVPDYDRLVTAGRVLLALDDHHSSCVVRMLLTSSGCS